MPLMYNIGNYGRYPVNIYNRVIRFILTFVLPFAFVGVYPAAYFLRKTEWNSYAFATPLVGVICFTIAITLWNQGEKGTVVQGINYKSLFLSKDKSNGCLIHIK